MALDHRAAAWDTLRRMRSSRPPLASKGARAETFASGLDQAERLWGAAGAVGPIASPILLFYGLTQAARAFCAAAIPEDSWPGSQSHGLKFKLTTPVLGTAPSLAAATVLPLGNGLVQQVAAVLRSPVLADGATLSALIASSPEGRAFLPADLPDGRRPLRVHYSPVGATTEPTATFVISPVPIELLQLKTRHPASAEDSGFLPLYNLPSDEITEWLANYPRLAALGPHLGATANSRSQADEDSMPATVTWPSDGIPGWPALSEWVRAYLDVVDDDGHQFVRGWALPRVGSNDASQHPLIRWWVILYTLSMLARYQPSEWRALLNVDSSTTAVPLEGLLDDAAATVPQLLAVALAALT